MREPPCAKNSLKNPVSEHAVVKQPPWCRALSSNASASGANKRTRLIKVPYSKTNLKALMYKGL